MLEPGLALSFFDIVKLSMLKIVALSFLDLNYFLRSIVEYFPFSSEASFIQSTRMQRFSKTI